MVEYKVLPECLYYRVGNDGSVWSRYANASKRLMGEWRRVKTRQARLGYWTVSLQINKKGYTAFVHRLVGKMFVPNPHNNPEINHINGDSSDPRPSNLEWVTASENHLHRCRVLGRYDKKHKNPPRGVKHGLAKLNDAKVRTILKLAASGETHSSIALRFGIHKSNVSYITRGLTWSHVTGIKV